MATNLFYSLRIRGEGKPRGEAKPRAAVRGLGIRLALVAAFSAGAWILIAGICALLAMQAWRALASGSFAGLLLWPAALLLILRSLLSRPHKFAAPGPEVRAAHQPELFALIGRVARAAGAEMPQRVYLTGELNASAFQPAPALFGSRRCAIAIGLPLLQTLTVSELESVVAHAVAHYRRGGARLSAWIWRTRSAILRSTRPLRISPLQLVIEWYRSAYLNLTAVIARQQEFAADAFAAKVAGADAAASSLSNPRMSAYLAYWKQEMSPLQANGFMPPVVSGFAAFCAARPEEIWRLGSKLPARAALEGSAEHASLQARLQAIAALEPVEPLLAQDNRPVIGLLRDAEETAYQLWMSAGGRVLAAISWEETMYRIFVPRWRELVAAHADLFAGVSAETFDSISRQRVVLRVQSSYAVSGEEECKTTAERLAACALGVALLDDGWAPCGAPGSPYEFEKDGRRMRPIEEIRGLWSGRIRPRQWRERMAEFDIGELQLV